MDIPALPSPKTIQPDLYPTRLSDFVGNEQAKKIISVTIDAFRTSHMQPPHILFLGPRGFGKTALAVLVAKELGLSYRLVSAKAIENLNDLNNLMHLKLPEILILDEIHGLKHSLSDLMHQAMDTYEYSYTDEKHVLRTIKTRPFSLLAMTTDEGRLTDPFRSRFRKIITLKPYTTAELQIIIMNAARNNRILIDNTAAFELAARCNGVPRLALRNLQNAYEYALKSGGSGKVDYKTACDSLELNDIDPRGLCWQQRTILQCLDSHPLGIDNIANRIGVSRLAIETFYEPFLMEIGFIEKTRLGRVLTDIGKKYKIVMKL
jgi:Holliday junction DNA helicase RuvB